MGLRHAHLAVLGTMLMWACSDAGTTDVSDAATGLDAVTARDAMPALDATTRDAVAMDVGVPDAGADLDAAGMQDTGPVLDTGAPIDAEPRADADALRDADAPLPDADAPPPDADAPLADADTPLPDADTPLLDADTPPPDADTPLLDADTPLLDADAPLLDAQPVTDADLADAAPALDATLAPDAALPVSCDVVVNPPEAVAGQVGASGGSPGLPLVCPAGTEVIGVAVRMSNGNTSNNGRSAVGLTLSCAAVTLTSNGPSVGVETLVEVMGTGQFGWSPATQSPVAYCPPGSLVSGLTASRGTTGNRFLEVTMSCTALLLDGSAGGATQSFAIAGTLQEAGQRDVVQCPAGQVVRSMQTRTGAGLDAAILVCAAPACGP